jgi:20S proteasome subunit alpha 7
VLIASYAEEGPQLYSVDPSGVSYRYFATAIGKGKNGAKSQLEKLDLTTLTAREAVIEAAKVLGLSVHDHVIVGRDGLTSFRAQGLI